MSGPGKFGDCARDMVGGCRRCGRVVCRVSDMSFLPYNINANDECRTAQSNLPPQSSSAIATAESAQHARRLHCPSLRLPLPHLIHAPSPEQPVTVLLKVYGYVNHVVEVCALRILNTSRSGSGGRGICLP